MSIPAGLLISALLIWQASYAAFSDKVASSDNTWTAGSVTFKENEEVGALFEASDLVRNSTDTNEISVTYNGTLDAMVSFYGEDYEQTNNLGDHIWLVIEGSEGAKFNEDASGVIFQDTLTNFSTTRLEHPVEGDVERTGTFRFTYTLLDTAPDTVQGGTAEIDFVLKSQGY